MATPRYHVHIDAAHMPSLFSDRAAAIHGLKYDNFEHSFLINGIEHKGEHYTRYIFDDNSEDVRIKCEELSRWAADTDFVGLIQCEFIVEELEWNGSTENETSLHAPFKIDRRPLDAERGEKYKKHELHLEIKKSPSSRSVIGALMETGMEILENDREVTFTACGNPKELMLIKKTLKAFLNSHHNSITGKLTYEATAFWSLHNMETTSLPMIVDTVTVLQ